MSQNRGILRARKTGEMMLSITSWMSKIPFDVIRQIAAEFDLEPLLLAAMIIQESGGEPCAMRFESHWSHVWRPATFAKMAGTTHMTEVMGQKISWGPMQVMGTCAREQGYIGAFPALCDFELGTYYGAKILANKVDEYADINDAISAYNAGTPRKNKDGIYRNQHYVNKVKEYWNQLEGS